MEKIRDTKIIKTLDIEKRHKEETQNNKHPRHGWVVLKKV